MAGKKGKASASTEGKENDGNDDKKKGSQDDDKNKDDDSGPVVVPHDADVLLGRGKSVGFCFFCYFLSCLSSVSGQTFNLQSISYMAVFVVVFPLFG
jgi:hypothetical protein